MTHPDTEARAEFERIMREKHPFWSFQRRYDGNGWHEDYDDSWIEHAWQTWLAAWNARPSDDRADAEELKRLRHFREMLERAANNMRTPMLPKDLVESIDEAFSVLHDDAARDGGEG